MSADRKHDMEHQQEIAQRDRQRSRDDEHAKTRKKEDPRETTEPPQPFSGADH